jgi:hypothetical protein
MPIVSRQRGAAFLVWLIGLIIISGAAMAVYVWAMLSWSYSEGERAGWIQKLSKKGWLCKTWEGEMAMVSLPGSMPEKFLFTVHDTAVAEHINAVIGKRVSLHYEEHIGLPSTCFGDTRHFVNAVKNIEEQPSPLPFTASPTGSADTHAPAVIPTPPPANKP